MAPLKIVETVSFYFLGVWNHCAQWLQPWKLKKLAPRKESYDKQHIKSNNITLPAKHHKIDSIGCVAREDSWESLEQQGDQNSQS